MPVTEQSMAGVVIRATTFRDWEVPNYQGKDSKRALNWVSIFSKDRDIRYGLAPGLLLILGRFLT